MSELVRGAQRGCLRALSIRVLAILVVVPLGCLLILLPAYLVMQMDLSIWVLVISSALYLLILFGGGGGLLAFTVYRRSRHLDALFTPLGLHGSLYQFFFRQYHGRIGDRHVSAYFFRGPTLDIEVGTSLQTRLTVTERDVDTSVLARTFGKEPLSIADERLSDLIIFGIDEKWARALLREEGVSDLLHQLIRFEGPFVRRQVLLGPARLRLRLFGNRNLFRFDLKPEQAERWVRGLLTLIKMAETVPDPEVLSEETGAERLATSIRQRSPYTWMAITLVAILAIYACAGAVGVATFLFLTAR